MEFSKWLFTGRAEFFNRDTGRMDEISINKPMSIKGRSEAEALNRVKFNIRKNNNLPMNTRIALFDYTLEIIPEESDFKYSGQTKKCDQCGTLLTDAGECPKCDLLDDRYDESALTESIDTNKIKLVDMQGNPIKDDATEVYVKTLVKDLYVRNPALKKDTWLASGCWDLTLDTHMSNNPSDWEWKLPYVFKNGATGEVYGKAYSIDEIKDYYIKQGYEIIEGGLTESTSLFKESNGENKFMRKLRIIESVSDKEISILDFKGLSKYEIKSKLDNAPIGAIITGVRDKSGRYSIDTHIEKRTAYKSNYFNPLGSPHDYKSREEFWTVGSSEQYYMTRMISEILNDTSKYYKISPELTATFDKEIFGCRFYSEMTDINFFAVHENKQVLKTNYNDISEYLTGSMDDEAAREQLFKDLTSKGIVFGCDEMVDGYYWHEATNWDPYDEEGKQLDYFVILLGSIQNFEDWYKINIISDFSSRF